MKAKLFFGALLLIAFPARAQEHAPASAVTHLATALDHLTVIELGEPVTLIAAGSDAFEVERREDKILIRPLATGVATDLLVWTPTRRLIYELDPPGEVMHMNFAVDSRGDSRKSAIENRTPPEPSAEALMARAFLAALPVASDGIHEQKGGITLRVEHVLFSKSSVYLHCSIRNQGQGSYPLANPRMERLLVSRPGFSLAGRRRSQLTRSEMGKMRGLRSLPLPALSVQVSSEQVVSGQTAEIVIAVAQPLDPAALLSLTFASYGSRPVQAFVVL